MKLSNFAFFGVTFSLNIFPREDRMQFTLQRKLSPLNFLTHPVYNINKMQDFSSKTTFIII